MGDKNTEMATKPLELDRRTTIANYINEAAAWLQMAMDSQNPVEKEKYETTAMRWLERTKVVDIMPPSIEAKRYGK